MTRFLRASALLAIAWSLAACDQAPKTLPDIAKHVLSKTDWMADSKECPDKFVPKQKLTSSDSGKLCDGDRAGHCYAECESGDVHSCYWLAYSMQLSNADENATQALYQRSCKLGEPSGCTNRAAWVLHTGMKDPAALACSTSTFSKTCALEDAWGCTMFALALHGGLGTVKDDQAALSVIDKACTFGTGPRDPACTGAMDLRKRIVEGVEAQ